MFQAQTVTLEPDAESMVLKGTVTLEPILMSRTSVPPRAARIQVTFALIPAGHTPTIHAADRVCDNGSFGAGQENSELPPLRPEESQSEDVILDEVKLAVEPVSTGAVS